jgi:hypothetical protein
MGKPTRDERLDRAVISESNADRDDIVDRIFEDLFGGTRKGDVSYLSKATSPN